MALSLTQIVGHAATALGNAEAILARHQADRNGLCHCMRPLPCSAAVKARLRADHWQARLDYFRPQLAAVNSATVLLPTVTR